MTESEKLRELMIRAGIPKKFLDIETYRKEAFEKFKNVSCFLYGDLGVGKSVLASSLARDYLKRGGDAKWINYPDFVAELKSLISTKVDTYRFERETSTFKGVLFIDDLGAESDTPYVREITYRVINTREMNLLATVITSNYSLNEIDQDIDRRISSRIVGMCHVYKLIGKDKRITTEKYKYPDPKMEEAEDMGPMPEDCRKELDALEEKQEEKKKDIE